MFVGETTAPASAGNLGDTGTHEVGHVVFSGPIKGVLLAKRQGKSKTRMYLSLHGLSQNTAYDVIGSTRPCNRSLTNASRLFGLDVAAQSGELGTTEWEDIVLTGQFRNLVSPMRSVRIIGEPRDGSPTQTRCYQKITFGIEGVTPASRLLGWATFPSSVKGLFLARATGASRARMTVSLHGLEPDTRYRVVGSKQACSRTHTGRVFAFDVPASAGSDRFVEVIFGAALSTTRSAKTIRVFKIEPGQPPGQQTCGAYKLENVQITSY